MEDLAFGVACVEASGCMGQCSKGPNGMYSEKSGAKGKITNKLNKYSKLTEMLGEVIQGFGLDELQSRVHKVKFAIRREGNADTRMQAIEETLSTIDDQQKQMHPEIYAEILCLRSRELTKADPIAAYNDLREALKLLPDWPWAFVSLAQVLDNLHMPRGALASMQRAIEIGTGVDKNALTRGMVRLERKAADSKGPDVPPEGVEMDIRYVKEKSLGGEVVTKADKKGKEKGKKEKEKEAAEPQEDKGEGEKPENPEKAEKKEKKEKVSKTKDGKEVKASKAKSKSKKGAGASKKEEPNAASSSEAPDLPKSPKSPKVQETAPEPELQAEQLAAVAKPVDIMKDLVAKQKEKLDSKDLKSAKSRDLSEKPKKHHGEKKKACDAFPMTFACKGKPSKHFESSIWHIDLAANLGDHGEEIQRSYTPYSTAEEYKKGILILLIKVYPNGRMSSYLGKMSTGENILVSNPVATVDPADYPEGGIMVAGGSAVVVALQVITAMLPNITDSFHLYLLLGRNREAIDR
ncbi:unnamed protein product [Cladocopium goreaui]|uniref:FAD-binding FR-type domain-containing protein n=1 Tax=Cladocopium goreaui TaxID=2562237 RepID=A0A9P1BGN8_9DINO|nr:unnamed protein product [Cladocopium goreaui]